MNMSLIKCPECSQEVSDTVDQCIKCGFTMKKATETHEDKKVENIVIKGVDLFFALLYVFIFYQLFFGDLLTGKDGTGAEMFGVILAIAVLYFVQKLTKAVLGTIARSFDSAFKKT